jgi:glycosyltransferase involved in cell wall biosynthesis
MGGVEKVTRAMMSVLTDLKTDHREALNVFSAYDHLADPRYVHQRDFTGFAGKRLKFSVAAIRQGRQADLLILSHINLAPVGLAIKSLNPKIRIVLMAHGIEVWPRLNVAQRFLLQQCTRIVAVSHYTKERMARANSISLDKIAVLNNPLDPHFELPTAFDKPAYLKERYHLGPDDFILLTITRKSSAEKYKGYEQVLKAVAQLKEQYPQLKYVLAGKADAVEQKYLEETIAALNVTDRVRLVGFVDEQEVSDHFLLADVFVMPSQGEGFGIVFIEALACGLPVIAGNKDGSVDALADGELGTLVNPDSAAEVAEAIRREIDQSEKVTIPYRRSLSEATVAKFGYPAYQKQWHQLLKEL